MSDAEEQNASGMTGDNNEEYFLDRWSRRKTASRKDEAGAEIASAAPAADAAPEDAATAVDAEPRQELTDADMPPLDSLHSDSDYSVFMSPGVSEQLRTRALRKLFHLPAFNVTDGLNDYDEDYTRFASLGNVVTQEMKRLLKRELSAEEVSEDEAGPVVQPEASAVTAAGDTAADTDPVEALDEDSGKA